MGTRDLLQEEDRPQTLTQHHGDASTEADTVTVASHRLAVRFAEETQLPARYRRLSDPSRKVSKVKEDSEVEKRFKANVESWRQLIETMLAKIDEGQAWRFINVCPTVANTITRVTDNSDFCEFKDYMIPRRDKEQSGPDELGGLSFLSVALQREIEKQLPE